MSEEKNPATTSLTIRETELAVIALQALKNGKVDLDEAKFAQMAGYSTTNSAKVCFANLKRKLNEATVAAYYVAAGTGGSPKTTPKKPRAKASPKSKVDTPIDGSPTKRKEYPTEETTPAKRSKPDGYVKKEEDAEEASAATEDHAHDSEI
ncbi:MAG: hypothetical protein L6R38_004423 [Xanthoria sp. 2 TBL-2021]|nr:MAG: hypothetical protein L6R38_004423 [Xanthoria sp. 2 TBL-2021]